MASRVLPPRLTPARFDAALTAFGRVVGKEWVLSSEDDLIPYYDLYPLGDPNEHAPSAAVAPQTVEEIQAIVRLANQYKTPLWPISRGKNLGYGGAAPRMRGTVVLDLSRMRRILEVDARYGYCMVEPGVGFFDLYEHLQANKIPLWMAVPGQAWGSVMGNALDRGNSTFPFGDHASRICGLEVVLPSGELVRTGMGAMTGNPTWPLFKYGFGPSWEQMFTQSNLGIVTKMGLWLLPEPAATMTMAIDLPNVDDLAWAIDELFALKSQGVLQQNPAVSSWMRAAGVRLQRDQWFKGEGSMPDDAVAALLKAEKMGWWGVNLRLYGQPEVNEVHARIVRDTFARHTGGTWRTSAWKRGDPIEGSGAGIPSLLPMQMADWRGGRGAHLTFSPAIPPDGKAALSQSMRAQARFREHGLDYYGGFTMGERHVISTSGLIWDRSDAKMTAAARHLFDDLLKDTVAAGYSEYRTHLSFMDDVAKSFDFNGHALMRLNETVKNALDPNGIIAPGKQGVWPRAYKGVKA